MTLDEKHLAMKTRTIAIVAVVALIVLGVAVYFLTRPQAPAKPEKIVVAARKGTYSEGLKVAAREYEKKTGIKVEVVEFDYAGLHEKLAQEVVQATGAYDVVMLDDPWLPEFADSGLLVPLDDLLAERGGVDPDFIDSAVNVCKYKGKLYAIPYVGNVQLFVYNKKLFGKYGLKEPKTWDDVLEAAKVIYEKEGIAGYVFRAAKGNPIVTNLLPIFWGKGVEIVDNNGNVDIDTPEAVEVFKFILELKKYTPKGVENYNSPEIKAALANEATAMSIVWPAWVPKLDATTWGVIVPPGSRPMIGAWLLGIPKSSKHQKAALDFILFVTSKEMQKKLAIEVGVPPTRESVYKDPDVVAKYPWYPVQLDALKNSKMRPRLPQWKRIEDTLANYWHQAFTGQLDPETALRKAAEEIRSILRG